MEEKELERIRASISLSPKTVTARGGVLVLEPFWLSVKDSAEPQLRTRSHDHLPN